MRDKMLITYTAACLAAVRCSDSRCYVPYNQESGRLMTILGSEYDLFAAAARHAVDQRTAWLGSECWRDIADVDDLGVEKHLWNSWGGHSDGLSGARIHIPVAMLSLTPYVCFLVLQCMAGEDVPPDIMHQILACGRRYPGHDSACKGGVGADFYLDMLATGRLAAQVC